MLKMLPEMSVKCPIDGKKKNRTYICEKHSFIVRNGDHTFVSLVLLFAFRLLRFLDQEYLLLRQQWHAAPVGKLVDRKPAGRIHLSNVDNMK